MYSEMKPVNSLKSGEKERKNTRAYRQRKLVAERRVENKNAANTKTLYMETRRLKYIPHSLHVVSKIARCLFGCS